MVVSPVQRAEALKLLTGDSGILDAARRVSAICRAADISAPVVGGVAVVLHGYVRTTADVDIFIADDAREVFVGELGRAEIAFNAERRAFDVGGIPVHVVTQQQLRHPPREVEEREGITVVGLADLIEMKLRSGMRSVARAQDIADVVGLARALGLRGAFARRLRSDVRDEYRGIVRALQREGRDQAQ